jgi:hypothetical protein
MDIDPIKLKEFVEVNPKLVTRKESKRYPGLFVLKYAKRVFYDNLWHLSPLLLECRGLVVDKDYNVIIKPFTKVFNHHENGTNIDRDEECTVVRKVNGFMGVATYAPQITDRIIYSTTGSLDSDFVDLIEKHVKPFEHRLKECIPTSHIFEICDESDPHIIYEEPGAYLIGASDIPQGSAGEMALDYTAGMWDMKRPEAYYRIPFSQVVKMAKECKHEGYMVYGRVSHTALKIKSPYYLVSKFLARAGEAKLIDLLVKNDRQAFRQRFDEEFYDLLDHLIENKEQFIGADEQTRISIVQRFLERV